jgi:hypothetical protein
MHRALAVWFALAVPTAMVAQPSDSAKGDSTKGKDITNRAARLFRSTDPIAITLESDFKTVFKDRDSLSTKTFPGKLTFVGEKGESVSLDVTLSTRGHFRLRTCDFLPLKVAFNKEQTKGTIFGGEGSLKLGTHCKNNDRMVQNTYVEYATNQMYNLLTPLSLKSRLAQVTWVDPGNPKFKVTQPGIWFQDQDDLMKEFGGKVVMQQGASGMDMEPRQMAINDVFQYFIGNTDFSVYALHNYRIAQKDSTLNYTAIAYDFDWSGLVNQPYAFPDFRLKEKYRIVRVTDRLYRGVVCYPGELLTDVLGVFRTKKDSLLGTLKAIKEITPARYQEAESFLGKFYQEIDNPKKVKDVFEEPCRRGG